MKGEKFKKGRKRPGKRDKEGTMGAGSKSESFSQVGNKKGWAQHTGAKTRFQTVIK